MFQDLLPEYLQAASQSPSEASRRCGFTFPKPAPTLAQAFRTVAVKFHSKVAYLLDFFFQNS